MEIGNIGKVANRKRMNVEVEQLREKVSRETTKIIKLKVAQDTAYWDLKEKLQQVEGNHERLQQNMVEVQMQHETISGQYQDELRLRPDTLNKLTSTREICEVLEDYSERLKETLSRCKADQAVLCEAYQKSGQLVREIQVKKVQEDEKNRQVINGLEDKVKMTSEHQKQLLHLLNSSKQQADFDIANLRQKLETIQQQKDDLVESVNELNRKLDLCNFNIEKKDETISNLQRDMKQLIQEFNAQSSEAKNTLMKQENELKEALEANSSLKRSLAHQEQFTQSVCEQKNNLQEKIAVLEEDQQNSRNELEGLRAKLEEATAAFENQKKDIATLINEKELLLNDIKDKEQIEKLNEQVQQINNEKDEIKSELDKNVEESKMKSVRIGELRNNIEALEKNIEEIENTHKTFKIKSEEKIKELSDIIEARDKELDSKASSITQLMSELKTSTDIRSKLETTLQKVRKEIDIERDGVKEKERKMNAKIEQLEAVIRDKEDELSKQMSIILEMRNEKERLQDKIQGMQNMIDNIQKELTGRSASAPRLQPEQDDNAVMLTPGPKKSQPPSSPIIQNSQFAVPRKDPKLDSMFFNLFSDSSMEGDTLDASEVNRRFAAMSRGERVSPMTLGSLKRRSGVPIHPANKVKPSQDCDAISLSQVKNDMKNKERTFFKNKRGDNKNKKIK
ncbi:putative leucine-rich repeat-containing protein DDB_G0290503 [Melitaea cinxia]|uniref:putative leucine-rich repeat-containing protein DDB_G0290503 n=1 Tax=Melitaea cinxia TaxID=113334 RepID=UPI001E271F7E|nr:putative leucine-rich repeat-containing protein DDB_G0290503 [Melitaea cinxia]